MNARKIRNICQLNENIYSCEVEFYSEKDKTWTKIPYIVNKDDDSEINVWILEQISSGKYKIKDQRV